MLNTLNQIVSEIFEIEILFSRCCNILNSQGPDNKTLIFRCFSGEKVEIKLLVPVCNLERENALVMASEMVRE